MRAAPTILTIAALLGAGPAAAATAKHAVSGRLSDRPEAVSSGATRYHGFGTLLVAIAATAVLDGAPRR